MTNNTLQFIAPEDRLTFKNGEFPLVVPNSASVSNIDDAVTWLKTNKAEIEQQLSRCGALLFRGFPVDSAESFDTFSAAFEYPGFTYQESLSNAVRINFTERVFTANEAPKDVEIFLHHEMAQTPLSPDKLFFFCESSAEIGGETPICRSDKLYEALKRHDPELAVEFRDKGLKYSTQMPGEDNSQSGQGRSWHSTLSVETREEAQQKLSKLGYEWQWAENNTLTATTPVLPAVRELSNGVEVFYNQLIAAYLGWSGVRENPSSAINFGDGSPIPVEGLELIVDLAKQFTYDLAWQDGDVALIDNKLVMHGRKPFGGERKRQVMVALAT